MLAMGNVSAQEFPNRPVRIIVPFAAGGPNDVAARLVAESLRTPLGQTVVIENRSGGGGVTGVQAVAVSPPDGYTLAFGSSGPLTISPSVKTSPYDVEWDFAPIGQVYRSAQVLAVHPALGVKSVVEFVAFAKANPGKISMGSAGTGTLPHLSIEALKRDAGVDVVHVPYRATSAALADLLGGQINALFGDVAVIAPNIQSGKLVALAVTSPDRVKLLPEIATMRELGLPALEVESWGGLLAPSGVPANIIGRLDDALQKAMADPAFRAGTEKQGWSELATSPAAFGKLIASDTARWRPIVTAPNFRLD
ncbi:MAG TPA: tripartite tricarboxylate transporter substrate binding protein [Xanthobacteraceae bacterium]|nr:tripartite tricarboxylate transporter substrate binding protein [Xanthobacteraceae bacterium]